MPEWLKFAGATAAGAIIGGIAWNWWEKHFTSRTRPDEPIAVPDNTGTWYTTPDGQLRGVSVEYAD